MSDFNFTDLQNMIGQEIGLSDWVTVDQERITAFAEVTGDDQWIHTDPERAARETPFGGTIAHGYLTLSMLAGLVGTVKELPTGVLMGINYGLDKVRFLNPVRAGSRVRNRAVLVSIEQRDSNQWLVKVTNTVEIEGESKPALVAESLALFIMA